jgi:Phage tail lysozyme
MVGLLSSVIPTEPLVTSEAPKPLIGGEALRDAFGGAKANQVSIAPGLNVLGQGLDDLGGQLGKVAGAADAAKAVTRNPDGSLNVATPQNNIALGQGGPAYQKAVEAGLLASLTTDASTRINNAAQKNITDPVAFQKEAGDIVDDIKAKLGTGPLGQSLAAHATEVAGQTYNGLVDAKAKRDVASSQQSILTQIEDGKNKMIALARQGGTDLPAFQTQAATVDAFYDQLGKNPLFGYSADKIASEKARFHSELQFQGVVGNVDTYKATHGVDETAKMLQETILDNPNSPLSDSERHQIYQWGMHRLNYQSEEQKGKTLAADSAAQGMITLYQTGKPPTDDQFDAALQAARDNGSPGATDKLNAARAAYEKGRSIAPLSLPAQQQALMGDSGTQVASEQAAVRYMMSKGWSQSAASAQIGHFVYESGGKLNPNARNPGDGSDGSDSIGIGQWNGQRAKALMQFAERQRKPWNDLQTQLDFADSELNSSEISAGTSLKAAKSSEEAALAMLGYERPKGWAPGVDPSLVAGWSQRLANTQRIAGGGANTSPIPFTPDEIKANPFLVSAAVDQFKASSATQVQWARTQATAIESMIKGGVMPTVPQIASVLQVAEVHPQELGEQSQRLQSIVAASPLAAQAAGMPNGQAVIDQAWQTARQSPSIQHFQFAQAVQDQYDARVKALQDNPHEYAARPDVGWIPRAPIPLNPADQSQFAQGIIERRQAADAISSRTGQSPESVTFTSNDTKLMSAYMASAPAQAVDTMMRGLTHGLTDKEQQALEDDKTFSGAVAGMARSGDPERMRYAFSYMRQMYEKNPVSFEKDFGSDVVAKMKVFEDKWQFMPPDQAMKEVLRADDPSAARARDELRTQAEDINKKLTVGGVVSLFPSKVPFTSPNAPVSDGPNASGSALLGDYRSAYADGFVTSGGDKSLAQSYALESVSKKWGVSPVNDGRVMSYPPERYYPQVNGSHDWLREQLDQEVRQFVGPIGHYGQGSDFVSGSIVPENAAEQKAYDTYSARRALVADDQTKTDIGAGKPPSYKVVVQDKNGQFHMLEQSPGVAMRFHFDPAPANARAEADFTAARENIGKPTAFDAIARAIGD